METTHTPEPWASESSLVKKGKYVIANVNAGESLGLSEMVKRQEANAARIVACVNACAGLKNEELSELHAIINEGTIAIDENKKLKAEREELINLLKQSHDILTKRSIKRSESFDAMTSKFLQALKEAKGGSDE